MVLSVANVGFALLCFVAAGEFAIVMFVVDVAVLLAFAALEVIAVLTLIIAVFFVVLRL